MSKKLVLILLPVLTMIGPPLAFSAYHWLSRAGFAGFPLMAMSGATEGSEDSSSSPGTNSTDSSNSWNSSSNSGSSADSQDATSAPQSSRSSDNQSVPARDSFSARQTKPQEAGQTAPRGDTALRPEGQLAPDFGDAIRFDATPSWVIARWPRVSSALAPLQLQGYRVVLVTGTAEDDLAGSLTYYFNARQQVQRITFQGTTGDARKLIQFLVSRYQFARRLVNNPRLFRYEVAVARGPARSYLEIRPAKVLRADDAHHRLEVSFVIERPDEK